MCPDAIFVPPDFDAYRARSRDVMARPAQPRGARGGRGPRRGLPRPHRARPLPLGRPRASRTAVQDRDRAHLLDRPRAQQAGGQGRLGCREAGRLRRAHAPRRRGCASPRPPPGLVPGIGPKTVARLGAARHRDPRRASAPPLTRSSREWFGLRLGPHLGRARSLRGRALHRDRARGQVRVARDHLRPRPARPRPARAACCERLTERALRDARPRGAARPHDRHQGPLRRLHDGHPRPQPRRRR